MTNHKISIPAGTSIPAGNKYEPQIITIKIGDSVTWSNDDKAAHTITSGTAKEGPDKKFHTGMILAGKDYVHEFKEAGEFDYFCMVHPWKTGKIIVK